MRRRSPPTPDRLEPIHILMRFNDKLFQIGDVIPKHQEVIRSRAAVWIAKFGQPLAVSRIDQVNLQVARDTPSYLFLSQKVGSRHQAFRGNVVEMARSIPESEHDLAPDYYGELDVFKQANFWTKLSELEEMEPGELSSIWIASSGEAATRTLSTSMASLFIVREGTPPRRRAVKAARSDEQVPEALGSKDEVDLSDLERRAEAIDEATLWGDY